MTFLRSQFFQIFFFLKIFGFWVVFNMDFMDFLGGFLGFFGFYFYVKGAS